MALKALFEQEFHQEEPAAAPLSPRLVEDERFLKGDQFIQARSYFKGLLEGVQKEQGKIDALIKGASRSWKLSRMPLVDLNIMRIAVYEMLCSEEPVPFKVCINEAVEMAKLYGTRDSSAFVNGILNALSGELNSESKKE